MKPIVSIIVAARNEEKHIVACLSSLRLQTLKNIEILVIDGKSTDQTKEIVKKIAQKDKRIKLFNNPEQRTAEARNIGITKAKAEYICYLDSHTTASKQWVETLLRTIEKHKIWKGKIVGGIGSIHKNPNKEKFSLSITEAFQNPLGGGGTSYRNTNKIEAVDTAYACLYKKSVLEKIKIKKGIYYDPYFVKGQDAELNWRLNKAGYILLRQPKAITQYYKRSNQLDFRRQMIVYGFWRAKLTQKHSDLIKPTLYLPLTFYTINIITLLLSIINSAFIMIILILLSTYFLSIFITTIKKTHPLLVTKIILEIHLFYTIGLIKGTICSKNKTKDRVHQK